MSRPSSMMRNPRAPHPLADVLASLCADPAWLTAAVVIPPRFTDPSTGQEHQRHRHDDWEIKMLFHGALAVTDPTSGSVIRAPAFVLHPPRWAHQKTRPADLHPGSRFLRIITVADTYTFRVVAEKGADPADSTLTASQQAQLQDLLGGSGLSPRLDRALDASRSCRPGWGESYICALLIGWLRALRIVLGTEAPLAVTHTLADAVDDYFDAMYYDPALRVRDLARLLNLSPGELSRRYRKSTGTTLRQALLTRRLTRAKELLESGELHVSEVATRTGWKNQHYFSNAFLKHVGIRPSCVRPEGRVHVTPHRKP